MPSTLNKYQIDKLGNTLIYLSNNVGDFGKTKALKLLFLLEEKSIKEFGVPFFGFDFKVWQFGPVIEEVYEDLSKDDVPLLNKYIKRADANREEFEASSEFNDDEFSNNDIFLIKEIVQFAKHKIANDLVRYTHGKDSLWQKAAIAHGLLNGFNEGKISRTNYLIDFSSIVANDEYLKERYENSLDFLQFTKQIKT